MVDWERTAKQNRKLQYLSFDTYLFDQIKGSLCLISFNIVTDSAKLLKESKILF